MATRQRRLAIARIRAPRSATGWAVLTCLAAFGLLCLHVLRQGYQQDTWLALVAGREVATRGIPHHDALTVISAGRSWVDAQWASQLAMYGMDRLLGLRLLGAVQVLFSVGSLAAAAALARRLGASALAVLLMLPWAAFLLLEVGFEVRPQTLAYPLFVALLALLASDARAHSSRVLWSLPLLALWGNVHGSAALAAALVMLRGVTLAWSERHARAAGPVIRAAVLTVGAFGCLLVTPYGSATLSYYDHTLLASTFHRYVSEWRPLTAAPKVAVPAFALMAAMLWTALRRPLRVPAWDRLALLLTAGAAVLALRNVVWFGLATLALGSVWFAPLLERSASAGAMVRVGMHRALALGACTTLLAIAVLTVDHGDGWFSSRYPAAALAPIAAATRHGRGDVFADDRYADWLLWRIPALRGRVAYDARFELLHTSELASLAAFARAATPGWPAPAAGYRVLVLDRRTSAAARFGRLPGERVLFRDRRTLVLLSG